MAFLYFSLPVFAHHSLFFGIVKKTMKSCSTYKYVTGQSILACWHSLFRSNSLIPTAITISVRRILQVLFLLDNFMKIKLNEWEQEPEDMKIWLAMEKSNWAPYI